MAEDNTVGVGGGGARPPGEPHFWLQSERVGSPGTFQRRKSLFTEGPER